MPRGPLFRGYRFEEHANTVIDLAIRFASNARYATQRDRSRHTNQNHRSELDRLDQLSVVVADYDRWQTATASSKP
jgi:hypothetical protein